MRSENIAIFILVWQPYNFANSAKFCLFRADYHEEDPQPPRRQPQRNRHPRASCRVRNGHPHGGHLLQRRPLRTASLQGRRVLSGRRRQEADPGLPGYRRHHPRRQGGRGRCDPPGLRLPVREPGFRRCLRRQRHRLHRAEGRRDAHARQQGRGARAGAKRRRAGGAGDRRVAERSGWGQEAGCRSRLPADAESQLGRRRTRHARDRNGSRSWRR